MAKGDSGASTHYVRPMDSAILTNIDLRPGPTVHQPDATPLKAMGTGQLPLSSKLSSRAQQGLIVPNLRSSSLVAMGPLCDDGCHVVLSKDKLSVVKDGEIILRGTRNKQDDLWDIPLHKNLLSHDNYKTPKTHPALYLADINKKRSSPPTPERARIKTVRTNHLKTTTDSYRVNAISRKGCAHLVHRQQEHDLKYGFCKVNLLRKHNKISVILRKKETKTNLVKYLHAACFSPVRSTWIKAIQNNNFATWPGLTDVLVKRHLPDSTATVQGHIHKERQNLQSTKEHSPDPIKNELLQQEMDVFPASPTPNLKTNAVAYILVNKTDMVTAYQDLTGRFPYKSSRGNEYILIGYHYDANCILGHPVKDRKAPTLTSAWKHIHNEFSKAGVAPEVWILDNEVSADLKTAFTQQQSKFQLVPPNSHRRNLAERAIQTWKNHFKSGLATADPNFPLSEWDRLIPQANITLNLLRTSRANPALSAHAHIYGQFDFSVTPLAPPGTKVVVQLDPKIRGTWELNGDVGWYVGPALDHYRCVTCYFPRTRTTRVCETVTFFPHKVPFPKVTLTDHLT